MTNAMTNTVNCVFASTPRPAGNTGTMMVTCANADAVSKSGAALGSRPTIGVCAKYCVSRKPIDANAGPLIDVTVKGNARVIGGPVVQGNGVADYLQTIPMERLGDGIEIAIKRFGLDAVATWWESRTGKPCGCPGRKAWFNELGRRLKSRMAKLLATS